jgi:ferredoxin-NADP reductase
MPIYKLKLLDRREIARGTLAFYFEKPEGFTFLPGQYGGFTLINPKETDASGITRRFSLMSTPDDPFIAIVTRIQQSAFKRELQTLPTQNEIKFAGPTGSFILHTDTSVPAVFIAGGIGIAPFYSMIKHAANSHSSQKMILFYGNQSEQDSAFLDELIQLPQQHTPFTCVATLANPEKNWTGETGFITHTMIRKHIPDIHAPIYYICGSPVMVTTLQELLAEMGIDEDKIKVEDFPGY